MRDITAILIQYSAPSALSKALRSLAPVRYRMNAVIIFQQQERAFEQEPVLDVDWSDRTRFIPVENQDEGDLMQDIINTLNTTYVLVLSGTDYLPAGITSHFLQLTGDQAILDTFVYNRDTTIRQPLLVRTSFLKQHPLVSTSQLPFKEALLPVWLVKVKSVHKTAQENLVEQTRKNSAKDTVERHKFIQKYDLDKKSSDNPGLSIIVSAYNMEAYVQTAVGSCLLQNELAEQVLIMDDGSVDKTWQRLQYYRDHPGVEVFSKENGGKARALNSLLPHVTSEFILELDADDWLDPDAVSVIKKQLRELPYDVSVLYGNLRKWKQLKSDVSFKGITKGTAVRGRKDLLSYRLPLGPRIYRNASLQEQGGIPVINFADGRLYEDVSVLYRLLRRGRFQYRDFTVYNVREHKESITKQNLASWHDFLKTLE